MTRHEKRSESLEIRLGHSAKQAFMEACREQGVTASEVVRAYVEGYPVKKRTGSWVPFNIPEFNPMHASILALLSAVALASSASVVGTTAVVADLRDDPEEQFADLDADGDGFFNVQDLYRIAGLTPEGALGPDMVADVSGSIRDAIAEYGPAVTDNMTSDEFIERTLYNAGEEAKASVDSVFHDVDADGDQRVSRSEFLTYHAARNLQ